ncbi:uncharacterized protein EDB93DRAFT_1259201 [Suillus bovinus]|uniref:uncharacterized protein n=1 Tax=Suillus bovinus TaxID=48563 RepID=UPI001B861A7E|nr:uncharacterized protein EDB93DRAFT_1259201 [Suillus bovinus]KAG2122952.1 hypothetical protein EDB93DRAFT_1259201 [Suillus bovinus]
MNGSSTSAIQISLWHTWALTVTHKASEYTAQKFNAEKTGGDPVIPSANLDTDLVMACDQLVDCLIKAYENPIQMNINIGRYSKLISPKNTKHNEEKEEKLLKRCPPGHEGTRFMDIPATILDVSSTIIAWYLPDALTAETQMCDIHCYSIYIKYKMVTTEGNLGSHRVAVSESGKKCKEDVGLPAGCINLSPAWFQQGHENIADPEVSASLKGPLSEEILNAIVRPAAIASAALRIMHPEQYWAGLRTFSSLREKAESKELPRMSKILQYWASVFNTLSVISNRQTPHHRDNLSIPECFDILTTVGNYSNAWMSMPSLWLEFGYDPGCMIGFFRKDCQTWGS